MSWLFGSWLGGGSGAGGEGGSKDRLRSGKGSSKIDILSLGSASFPVPSSHSVAPQPTPHVKAGNYDLRIPSSPADGLLTGGTPQQHALVEFKRAIQVRRPRVLITVLCPLCFPHSRVLVSAISP